MAPIGFRILPFAPQPPAKTIATLRKIATAHLSDNMNRLHAIGPDLWPCHSGGRMVGTALTVKVGPGDNLMVHKAIDIARPGDVIVVDAGGICTQAIIGEISSLLNSSYVFPETAKKIEAVKRPHLLVGGLAGSKVHAERQVAIWKQQLDDAVIRAPFTGVVVAKSASDQQCKPAQSERW